MACYNTFWSANFDTHKHNIDLKYMQSFHLDVYGFCIARRLANIHTIWAYNPCGWANIIESQYLCYTLLFRSFHLKKYRYSLLGHNLLSTNMCCKSHFRSGYFIQKFRQIFPLLLILSACTLGSLDIVPKMNYLRMPWSTENDIKYISNEKLHLRFKYPPPRKRTFEN